MKLLMIDDDEVLCDLTSEYLSLEGIQLNTCHTGKTGLVMAQKNTYDAIILDIMLPDISGLSVLKTLVHLIDTPILMLTAKGQDIDQVVGLEIGADDYIHKPCNPKVLVSRIKAVLKRGQRKGTNNTDKIFKLGDLEVNKATHTATINQKPLKLTNSEFSILSLLISQPNEAFSKKEIYQQALEKKLAHFDRSLDVHICKLRTKIKDLGPNNIQLKTLYALGYMLTTSYEN